MNAADKRRIVELDSVVNAVAAAHPGVLSMELVRLVGRMKVKAGIGKKAIPKALPFVPRKKAKQEKRRTHREETARIRAIVMARANGRCEYCGGHEQPFNPLHMHHEKGGSGKRRQLQSPENCKAIHMTCHEKAHGVRR